MIATAIRPPILVVPPNPQHTTPVTSPIRPPIMVVPPSRQFHLDAPVVQRTLSRQVDAYFAHSRHPHTPPANVASFPSVDVTPKNEFGVMRTAYDVNGQVWVKMTPCVPNAKAKWYHVGPMAMA